MARRPPDLFDRGWQAFCRALEAPIRGPGRMDLAAAGFLLGSVGVLLSTPVLHVQSNPLDLFVQLDGAWRWMAGQRPHVDFYTPVGDLWYVLLGVAGTLDGGDPLLVLHASILLVPFVAVGAWIVTERRLPPLPRVLLALAITCCALSPRTLDTSLISGVATYNRYGWSFVGIVAAAVLLPTGTRRIGPVIGVVAAALVATFWTKVTYLGLGAAALGLSALWVPANRRLVLGSTLVGGVGVAISVVSARGQAYLADLSRAAEAASAGPGLLRIERLAPEIQTNLPELVAIVALGLVVLRSSADLDEHRTGTQVVAAACAFGGAALVVASQSHDQWIPVLVIPIAMMFAVLRARASASPFALVVAGSVLCGFLAFGLALDTTAISVLALRPRAGETNPLAGCPEMGSGRCVGERIRVPPGDPASGLVEQVRSGELPGVAYDNLRSVPWNVDNAPILEDAMGLVVAEGLSGAKIASLTFSPAFPWLFGSPPPRHLPAWWDWGRTIGPADEARVPEMLSDADVVLVPKVWRVSGLSIATPTLNAEFEVRSETPLWTLWVRQSQPPGE